MSQTKLFILHKEFYELGFQILEHMWDTYKFLVAKGHWDNKVSVTPNKHDFVDFIMDCYEKDGGAYLCRAQKIGRSWWKCLGYNSPTFLMIVDHINRSGKMKNKERDETFKLVVDYYTHTGDFRTQPLAAINVKNTYKYYSQFPNYEFDNIHITRLQERMSEKLVLVEKRKPDCPTIGIDTRIIDARPTLWLDYQKTLDLYRDWEETFETAANSFFENGDSLTYWVSTKM